MRNIRASVALAGFLFMLGCNPNPWGTPVENVSVSSQDMVVAFDMSSDPQFNTLADSAIAMITCGDMDTIIANLAISASRISGTVKTVPAGKNRLVEIKVFDSNKMLAYYGSDTIDIYADKTVTANIILKKCTGTVIINGTLESASTPPAANGLVAYYPFSGNANDASGNGNNGTVYGAPMLTADRLSRPGSAYAFDGIDDSIIVPPCVSLNFGTGDFSICFWMKVPYGDDLAVMGKAPGGIPLSTDPWGAVSGAGWNIQVENTPECCGSGIRLDMWDGSNGRYNVVSSASATDNQWHFVAFTVNRDSTARLYVDGVLKDENRVVGIGRMDNNEPLRFGERRDWTGGYYNGSLDEVRIYNRLLSDSEIQSLFNMQ